MHGRLKQAKELKQKESQRFRSLKLVKIQRCEICDRVIDRNASSHRYYYVCVYVCIAFKYLFVLPWKNSTRKGRSYNRFNCFKCFSPFLLHSRQHTLISADFSATEVLKVCGSELQVSFVWWKAPRQMSDLPCVASWNECCFTLKDDNILMLTVRAAKVEA